MLRPVFTRAYFADEDAANAADPVLALVVAARRPTLIATVAGLREYRFDIRFQGAAEAAFFEL